MKNCNLHEKATNEQKRTADGVKDCRTIYAIGSGLFCCGRNFSIFCNKFFL